MHWPYRTMGHFLSNLLESSLSRVLDSPQPSHRSVRRKKDDLKLPKSGSLTWSVSRPPSFIDINTNALVYDNGALCTNFSHTDCCKKLENIITGSNQLKGRGQGKFCGKWEVNCSIPHSQELLVQPRMTVRH